MAKPWKHFSRQTPIRAESPLDEEDAQVTLPPEEVTVEEEPNAFLKFLGEAGEFLDITRHTTAGLVVGDITARTRLFKEGDIAGGLGFGGALGEETRELREEVLGPTEQEGIWDHLRAAYRFDKARTEAFRFEKALSAVYDPLNFIPLGLFLKVGKATRAATLARGGVVTRLRAAKTTLKPAPLRPKSSYANIPSADAIRNEGWKLNRARKLVQSVFKSPFGRVPLLRTGLRLLNPSGTVDIQAANRAASDILQGLTPVSEDAVHLGKKNFIDWMRTEDISDAVVTADIVPLRMQGVPFTTVEKQGNLLVKVKEVATGKEVEKPLLDVMERFGLYELDDAQKAVVQQADDLIDAYFAKAIDEGLNIKELMGFAPGEHYFPRIAQVIREVKQAVSPGGRVGARAALTKTRLHETVEEALQNGVEYFGSGSSTPIADMVETYMRSTMKMVADKRLADSMKPLATTLSQRMVNAPFGRSALAQVRDANRVVMSGQRVTEAIRKAILNKKLTGGQLAMVRRFSPEVAEKVRIALRKKKLENRIAGLEDADNLAQDLLKQARLDRIEAVSAKRALNKSLLHPAGLASIPQPAFSGELFPQEVVNAIKPFITKPQDTLGNLSPILDTATGISGLMRTGQLTLDLGFYLIQGMMVAAKAPRAWAKGVYKSILTLADPQARLRYLNEADTRKAFDYYQGRIHIGSPEMMEAFSQTGVLPRVGRALEKNSEIGAGMAALARKFSDQTFRRFQASFEMFFDVGRVEMAKGYIPSIEKGLINVDDAAQFINKVSGLTSSKRLGVSMTQRQAESAMVMLAPRYTRATMGLMFDALQGGFVGSEARNALMKFFGGTVALYTGLAMMLDQPVKLDPRDHSEGGDGGEFMTVEIDGQHVGLGTKPYSLMRALVRMGSDPENAAAYALRWIRSNSSPLSGASTDIITGSTYIGEPVKTYDQIARQEVAGRLMPFYAEAWLNDDPKPGRAGTSAEFAGLRSFPITARERQRELRDELAALIPLNRLTPDQQAEVERLGEEAPTWDVLSVSQKQHIIQGRTGVGDIDRRKDELGKWDELARELARERGDEDVGAFIQEVRESKLEWEMTAESYQKGVEVGVDSNRDFLDKMKGLNRVRGSHLRDVYDDDGLHAEAIRKLNESREDKFVPLEDLVRDKYIMALIGTDDLEDAFGNYKFEEAERRKTQLRQQYGHALIDQIEESLRTNKEAPQLWRWWLEDREMLRGYWDLTDKYLASFPKARIAADMLRKAENMRDLRLVEKLKKNPYLVRMNRDLRDMKIEYRERFPELDALLVFWEYAQVPRTERAENLVIERVELFRR